VRLGGGREDIDQKNCVIFYYTDKKTRMKECNGGITNGVMNDECGRVEYIIVFVKCLPTRN
jgi:hypothetical protein